MASRLLQVHCWRSSSPVRWLCSNPAVRARATSSSTCQALVYGEYGPPEEVVQLQEWPVAEMGAEDVTVDMLLCPVNPSDINQIQGVYPLKPPLPEVGGGEGVGVVADTGTAVTSLKPGDWVIPSGTGLGTWRTRIVEHSRKFLGISADIPVQLASTLTVNPPTAYRMLKDFVTLKPGDCVIQNGSNSGVGQAVMQIAAAWGVKTINIIRDRPNLEEMKSYLHDLGATEVVTEDFSHSHKMKALVQQHGQPVLALNCVGGKSALNLMRHLVPQAVVVTYGGMSREPVPVTTGSLIFKDLRIVGYWNSKWLERNLHSEEHNTMMSDLCELAQEGKLKPPLYSEYSLRDYKAALRKAMEPFVGTKQLLAMNS